MNIAFTIATANYLAQAKAVSDSFLSFHEGFTFIIVLLDKIDGRFDPDYFTPAQVVEIESLGVDCFPQMVTQYTIFELSNAMKPFVADHFFKKTEVVNTVLYLDSDILIYNSLNQISELLLKNDIVITPHFYSPPPLDGKLLDEAAFHNSGIYNGGFFALRKSDETDRFLSWWKERLKTSCFVDFAKGLFVDQIWLNFVPLYFHGSCILQNLAYNVAYWNLHERNVSKKNRLYYINTHLPLIFFHFSGFEFTNPNNMSRHQNRFSLEQNPDLAFLFEEYKKIVENNNLSEYSKLKCFYERPKHGTGEKAQIVKEQNERHLYKMTQSIRKKIGNKIRSCI